MKEAELFSKWADSVLEDASQPSRMGTPMKAMADRPLPREIDIQYKAQRQYPELSPEQALAKYLEDEMEHTQRIDNKQDKQIKAIDNEVDKVEDEEHNLESQFARLIQLIKTSK